MSIQSLVFGRIAGLPARLGPARRTRNIRVPMPDGVSLATDHFAPPVAGAHATMLMRVPYGIAGFETVAEVYAERGFNVVLQACRGTGNSEGEFDPLVNERADGLATLGWIKAQPWYDGRLGTSGPSYLGYAQWAISDALPEIAAMATKVTSSEFRSVVLPGGAFHLGLWLSWLQTIELLRNGAVLAGPAMLFGAIERRTARAAMHLPLVEADVVATGRRIPFWRRWFEVALDRPGFWEAIDHSGRLGPKTPPNHFMSGWYDFMIDQLLRDYATLVGFGHRPYLTIGPWVHVSPELQTLSVRETLVWMHAQLEGKRDALREKPVRIHVSGSNRWHEFDAFPPGPAQPQTWHLIGGGALSLEAPGKAPPARYRYDPARPTPNIGGAMFAFTGAGPVDNAPLLARRDVLSFISAPLTEPLTIVGNVEAKVFARATPAHADVFVRLCDLAPSGRAINICDGLVRRSPADQTRPDGSWEVNLKLHAAAHCFARGHRLLVLIAGGAHPRFARNPGTGEPIGTGTRLAAVDVEIFHDPQHPSGITLPLHTL